MSIGPSRSRIALAFVDDLLHDYHKQSTTKPFPRTTQQLFQRLLVVCGGSARCVAVHVVRCLLTAVDFLQDPPLPAPARHLGEQQAAQLLALIVEHTISNSGGRERSEVELRGSVALFDCLANCISDQVNKSNEEGIPALEDNIINKVIYIAPQQFQAVFLCCLGAASRKLKNLIERELLTFLATFASKNSSKCQFRTEFVVRLLAVYCEYQFSQIDPVLVRGFALKVIDDSTRSVIQPFICLLIYRQLKVKYVATEDNLKAQIDQLLKSGEVDTEPLRVAMSTPNYNLLCAALQEAGASCTTSTDTLVTTLKRNGLWDAALIGPSTVANAVVMMVRTAAMGGQSVVASWNRAGSAALADADPSSPQPWNGRVFAKVMHQLNSNLNWSEVILRLDQESFLVRDRVSLMMLSQLFDEAFQLNNATIPISLIYRDWTYRSGQLSWLQQIILNPEVFCLGDYVHTAVNYSSLKVQPEDSNRDVGNWKCMNLIETLLKISDQRTITPTVLKTFHTPLTHCPDILLLGLVQITSNMPSMRDHLIQVVCPMLLSSHPNAVPAMVTAWNTDGPNKAVVHRLIIAALISYYTKNCDDLIKLTKILEIGHELKPLGLSELFNLTQFAFTIDLACLASKRDFLKLDKWLEDKAKEHGDTFTQAVIGHMKRRLPLALGSHNVAGMSQETYAIVHTFLNKQAQQSQTIRIEYANLVSQLRSLQMKNETGRSSSVSSQGRAPVGSGPGPGGPPVGGGHFKQSVPGQLNLGGSLFGGSGGYGNSIFQRNGQDHSALQSLASSGMNTPPQQSAGAVGSSFGLPGVGQMSMSPSNSMMRSAMPGAQQPPQRQNSNTGGGWALPSNIPAPGAMRSTPGATTPQGINFSAQLPPTQANQDFQAAPRAMPASLANEDLTQMVFSEEVQDEANTYFEQIYSPNGQLSVTDLLTKLKAFQLSNILRERDVLACVVKNLFEEYRFFHEYPERELKTTAEVYGGIIREGIITNLQFATAVRKVIESLQADTGSMLWTFGIVALNTCKTKLCSYPKVCTMIMQHENFSRFPDTLKAYVAAGVSGKQPSLPSGSGRETPTWQPHAQPPQRHHSGEGRAPGAPGAPGAVAAIGAVNSRTGTSVLSYTNVDTLVQATEKDGAEVEQPPEVVLDKVSFLFNNLSQSNLQQKTDEMRVLIKENGEKFVKWLSQYIVMKRVSIEANFQPLYNNFVQAIDDRLLDKYVKEETFRNIKILLRADKRQAASNYSDRQLLKNLGMWLGAITIARSKPITISELDLKSLLMEAYYKGQQELLFVVPFIAKILISCAKTNIFSATSAWIRSILKILAELHNEPDLKINLKFEIEVLCKELSVDLSSLPIEGILKDTDRLLRLPQQLSDLKILQQPENAGSSPIPSQMRVGAPLGVTGTGGIPSMGGTDTKPSTPLPGSESAQDSVEAGPAPAHFAYHDINVVSFDGLVPHLKIPSHHPLFQLHPQMKHVIRPAINHAIKELIGPVTERALKVAMTVTEHVVKKDFSLDGDDQKMRRAGHHMMRAMTAGMAAITCRDPLQSTLHTYLVQAFTNSLRTSGSTIDQKMIEEAAFLVMNENLELATNFIVKTACEKATPELDKRIETELSIRAATRREGKEFTGDVNALAQQSSIPDKIRIRPGPISKEQMAVYEEFSTKICGFKPTAADDMIPDFKNTGPGLVLENNKEFDTFVQGLYMIVKEIDTALAQRPATGTKAYAGVQGIRDQLFNLANQPRNPVLLRSLVQKSVEQFLYAYIADRENRLTNPEAEWNQRLRDLFLGVVRMLCTQVNISEISKKITQIIVECGLEYRHNVDAIEVIYCHQLIVTPAYDQHLAVAMDNGGNFEATVFAQRLIKILSQLKPDTNFREVFPQTLEKLSTIQQINNQRPTLDGVGAGFNDRNSAAFGANNAVAGTPTLSGGPALPGAEPAAENAELQSKVEVILREWISLCYTPMAQRDPQQALATMIHMMHEHGVLATDDMITRFFRLCTEMCVDVSYRLLKNENANHANTVVRQRCYYTLDAFVKLTCLMVKHSDGTQHQTKINLLKKVLNIVTSVLLLDHECRRGEFHAMPYHRILIIMFNELTQPDPNLEPIAWPILEAFGQALFILQPRRAPRFSYAWLDIVGHRNVIARLLGARPEIPETVDPLKTSAMYTQLIICHLKFLAPFLRNIELPKSIAVLYKGTLRVLLVVLHDFPELLCEYHYVICDTIPPNCVQLRNLVLSAYPRTMRLPDPFALNFRQVDSIPEMAVEPKMNLNMTTIIPTELRTQLDSYLTTRSSVELLSTLPNLLQLSTTPGSKYNTTVLNAVVLYVGMRAIDSIHSRGQRISPTTIAHTAFMDIFQNLAVQLCTEGRYLLFNAIANQLRYPNAHTHYFSCTLLFLFQQADTAVIKEQITRILFERLVALRPHPWGLLITFIELIRNSQYQFWQNEFTKCAPEIERLFRNVAQTCIAASRESNRAIEGTAATTTK